MKRSDTCAAVFWKLEIIYQSSFQLNEPNAAYDTFNAIAVVTVLLYRWPYNNCTFVSATVSHNYSDIGTIEVDVYINTRHARVDAIQTIKSDELTALTWFQRHRTVIAAHSWRQIYRHDKVFTIFTEIGLQKSVSARRLLGLDRSTWTINQLGKLVNTQVRTWVEFQVLILLCLFMVWSRRSRAVDCLMCNSVGVSSRCVMV